MGNLIKAQLYQLKKSKGIIILFLGLLFVFQCTSILGEWGNDTSLTGSEYVAMGNGSYMAMVALLFPLLFLGYVCGADFIDKTNNYEVMAGHRRYEIYFSRAIVSLVGGLLGAVVLLFSPFIFFVGVMGWGDTLQLSDVLLRCALALFPILRVSCEFIFLSFIIKNSYITIALYYFIFVGGQGLIMLSEEKLSVLLGFTNVIKLFAFPSFMTYTVVDLKEYYIYESALHAGDVFATIAVSIVFGALFLYAGYSYFKKDDLN